jgi:hypothetical protein
VRAKADHHVRGGLLASDTVVLNMLDLARQIGAVPQPGTLGARVGLWMQYVAAHWRVPGCIDRRTRGMQVV